MDRICKIRQSLSYGKEEQASSNASNKFNETSKFLQNKRCMGETLLLIRFMSEKYEDSQNVTDQEKDKITDVLNKCEFKIYQKTNR